MTTKLVSEWEISAKKAKKLCLKPSFEDTCDAFIENDISHFLNDEKSNKNGGAFLELLHSEYKKAEEELNSERWVTLTDETYFDKKAGGCWILQANNQEGLYKVFNSGTTLIEVEQHINGVLSDPINRWKIPKFTQLKWMTKLSGALPFNFTLSFARISLSRHVLYIESDKVQSFDCDSDVLLNSSGGVSFPFLNISYESVSQKSLFIAFLQKGLTPLVLKESESYEILLTILHRKLKDELSEQQHDAKESLQWLHTIPSILDRHDAKEQLQLLHTAQQQLQLQYDAQINDRVISVLLNEDKIRADINPYHHKMLEDTEQGHWSLWPMNENNDKQETIPLDNKLVARDPKSSINDGVVGIDFGTKSTVVVYQKDNVNIHPMRIGTGDLSKEIAAFHYENPTVMEFRDLNKFICDYQAKANKPYTRWLDLTISHLAQSDMRNCESSQFNTFLSEIKQWAGDKNRKLKIVGQQGKVIDLPPFLEIGDNDFNPIEIYAYYLGLYINNQNNGIYLDYILSFPVTYEMPIRDKIIESFEKGLQKSLPAELGAETLAQLSVKKGVSEPAAGQTGYK